MNAATGCLLIVVAASLLSAPLQGQAPVTPRAGLVIDRSTTMRRGTYRILSADLQSPAIVIRGRDLVVDFTGVELVGSPDGTAPDRFAGLAILIDGGANITLRNARVHGYKVGILARNVTGLELAGNDVSDNWKQRLYSRIEKESLVDWMSYHQNERDEWLRYGAGLYLAGVTDGKISGNRALHGQNGLMVTRSRNLTIWNNELSFLSGIGLGLYQTTDSTVMHNKLDWCVRGYSHGFYNRGQDSAGLLMYEQSSRNVVAYNSVTHGGDGLFLWAGQSTMDTGEGGANDNLFFGNDFSHAPANGIEATFSRNIFAANRIEENWHGIWGGYSFDSLIADNTFSRNEEAIAIEHGQNNRIIGNTFTNDGIGIRLWANANQDPNWGYPKHRDTRSRDYLVAGNTMSGVKTPLQVTDTEAFREDSSIPVYRPRVEAPPKRPDGIDAMMKPGDRRGREFIIVDEWGPYDWRSPKLWPKGRSDESPLPLRVLGPPGRWTLESVRGATVSAQRGPIPDAITLTPSAGRVIDYEVRLRDASGKRFGYSRFFVPIDWQVRFYDFGSAPETPRKADGFAALTAGVPLKTERVDRLDYLSSRAIIAGLPVDHIALVADGEIELPAGGYTLRTISDDGVRVFIDGTHAIDNWIAHESLVDTAPLGAGRHRLRVEYYELTGFAELRVEVAKEGR
jgi:parallel beta-helix repeat protein